jgi:intein/homing endonuclease
VEEKNLDHHLKKAQTHKVLKFPSLKEKTRSNQEAYFAGIIDGEGCIAYEKTKKDYWIPSIAVEMTDKDVITRIHEFFGKGSVVYIKRRQEHHKDTWRWRIRGRGAVDIYFKIYNYLCDRRKNKIAEVLRRYCDDANAREKYKKLNGVLKNVVSSN